MGEAAVGWPLSVAQLALDGDGVAMVGGGGDDDGGLAATRAHCNKHLRAKSAQGV